MATITETAVKTKIGEVSDMHVDVFADIDGFIRFEGHCYL
jgi:hypothetical protein